MRHKKLSQWRDDIPLTTNPWKFFIFSSRPHRVSAFIALTAVFIGSVLNAGVPYIFKLITNGAAALSHGGSFQALFFGAWAYVIVTTLSELCWRLSGFTGSNWATRSRATARYALSSYVTLHSRAYFSDRFAGSLANKISHASNGMRDIVEYILWKIGEFMISVVASITICFFVNPMIGWLMLAWVSTVVLFNAYFGSKRMPLAAHAQELETRLTGATVDLLGNVSAMQEFARRPFELARIRNLTHERTEAGLSNWRYGERLLTFNGLVQAVFGASMVFMALRLAGAGTISTGDIVLVVTMIFRMRDQMLFIGSHLHHLAETWGEIQESLEEIIEPHEITDAAAAQSLVISGGAITFDDVTFVYGSSDREVLHNFSLAIKGKQKVGLVGKSGAGKSTLVKLLLRHYEINSGTLMIDGQDISGVTQDSLRESIAVVPQEPLLFHRSLKENIAYGNPSATDDEIVEAAGLAYADEFIKRLQRGYDTMVGERGVKLSGGERQRIAIARAILKDAPILLLDEATASLDSESESEIQKALHTLMQGKTVIAIAHRLSTLRAMDRIIVLDGGQIVQEGTHDELLAAGGIYADLWRHQAGGFLQDE